MNVVLRSLTVVVASLFVGSPAVQAAQNYSRVTLHIPRVTVHAVTDPSKSRLYADVISDDYATEDLVAPGQVVFASTSKGYIIILNGEPAWIYDRTTSKIFCMNARNQHADVRLKKWITDRSGKVIGMELDIKDVLLEIDTGTREIALTAGKTFRGQGVAGSVTLGDGKMWKYTESSSLQKGNRGQMTWLIRPNLKSWSDKYLAARYVERQATLYRGGHELKTDVKVTRLDYRDSGLASRRSNLRSEDGGSAPGGSTTLRPDGPSIDPKFLPSTPTLETPWLDPNRIAGEEGTAIDPRFRPRTPQLIPPVIDTGGVARDEHTFDPRFGPQNGISREELAERLMQERQERELQRRNSLGNSAGTPTLDPEFLPDRPTLLSPKQNEILPNGRLGGSGQIVWDFRWTQVTGADRYELRVQRTGSQYPLIQTTVQGTSYRHSSAGSYVSEGNLRGWQWSVRAIRNGQQLPWTNSNSFSVAAATN